MHGYNFTNAEKTGGFGPVRAEMPGTAQPFFSIILQILPKGKSKMIKK